MSSRQTVGRKMSASSADLSSPPKSPESPFEGDSIVVSSGPPIPTTSDPPAPEVKQEVSTKPKRIRKPKLAADGTEILPKPRKSRAKKKENDAPAKTATTTATTTTSSTSKPAATLGTAPNTVKSTRQPKINDLMSPASNSVPVQQVSSPRPLQKSPVNQPEAAHAPSIKSEQPSQTSSSQYALAPTQAQAPTPPQQQQNYISHSPGPSTSSRGQNYDPIRSSTITVPRSVPLTNPPTPVQISPVKPAPRASTSPSIASLINPPSASSDHAYGRPSPSFSPAQPLPPQLVPRAQSATPTQASQTPVAMPLIRPPTPSAEQTDAMELDSKSPNVSRKTSISDGSAASPNLAKAKEKSSLAITPKLPPLPGQGFAAEKASGARAIVIHVPLKGERNKYVSFQQLAVQKYGFNAVYPKLALQKDHLARVAANAAALERKGGTTSNDDMSIDGSDNEAELSSGSKRKGPPEADEPAKKKRLTKEDMYDKDDPFVDDSEMAWEEHAAAVKDGFFVYSGPLVPPGGEASIEKAEGSAAKKKPRPSRAGASKSSSAKNTKDKPDENDKDKKEDERKDLKPTTNGIKDGVDAKKTKPPAPPRKRPTKAEADARRAERERIAREKAAAAATAGGSTNTTTAANTPAATIENPEPVTASAAATPTANTTPKVTPAVPSPA